MIVQRDLSDIELNKIKDIGLFNQSIDKNKKMLAHQSKLDSDTYLDNIITRLAPNIHEYLEVFNAETELININNADEQKQRLQYNINNVKTESLAEISGIIEAHELLYELFERITYQKMINIQFINRVSKECGDAIKQEGPYDFQKRLNETAKVYKFLT
ncbi:MAG: hypothetical protein K0B02_04285 [DPANN group archaeon]|nr:hypothetical protein [DPANN group archaeon]